MIQPNQLQFNIGSTSFLARSIQHIAAFEQDESVEHFFYAALELRFGIEARLNEYLLPALKSVGKDKAGITDFIATKLLKSLRSIDAEADRSSTLRIESEHHDSHTDLSFTPVPPRLAAIHGKLGELLHFKFFAKNELWSIRKPLGGPHRSVANYLELLKEGIAELKYATSGSLISNPKFTQRAEALAQSIPDYPSTEDLA